MVANLAWTKKTKFLLKREISEHTNIKLGNGSVVILRGLTEKLTTYRIISQYVIHQIFAPCTSKNITSIVLGWPLYEFFGISDVSVAWLVHHFGLD